MNTQEAKERITKEFITRYTEWFNDKTNLSDREYGMKYIYCRTEKVIALKDNLTAVSYFQSHIYNGKWRYEWIAEGYDFDIIKQLAHEGFLSYTQYYNMHKHPDTAYAYISQKLAKQIYKDHKTAGL